MNRGALLLVLVLVNMGWAFAQLPLAVPTCSDNCRLPTQQEEGDIRTVDFTINSISFAKSRYPGLRGQGVTICLKENAPDPADIDLRGRLLPSALLAPVITPHATEMATILAGAGNFSPFSEGIAPKATLISTSFASLLPEPDAFYRTNGVTVVNHSYGTTIENEYGTGAVAYDASTSRLPTLLHIFSAGNLGYASSPTGPYAGLPAVATLTGNFKMSKNSLTVGAIGSDGVILASSSRGPAYDGRLKPELVAYSDEGSSGAAALASGTTALLQQALKQRAHAANPSAALIKALLINTADDVGEAGIDYQSGYGNINAFSALTAIPDNRYLEGEVAANGYFETSIQVPAARRLKITLVWTDPPAALNSPKALVNDLDLIVFDGQTSWQPWVLNPFPHLDSLRKRPVRMRDTLNNAEQVTLDLPAPGKYIIRVSGTRISTNRQPFAIAYQWEMPDTFNWTTPTRAVSIASDTTLTIRWENTTPAAYGTLDFSPDSGKSWTPVRDSVPLAPGRLVWRTPAIFGAGQLRMRIGDTVYASDTFRLSPVPEPAVLFACADSLGIIWTTQLSGQPITKHTLYRLTRQAESWEKVGLLTSNRYIIKDTRAGDMWAIAPVSVTGEEGIRSEPVSGQQVSCYYRTLMATLLDSLVQVKCELTSTEAVTSITFQKQTARGLLTIGTRATAAPQLIYTITDSLLEEGPNAYRVQLRLAGGALIYSDFVTTFVVRKAPVLIYPNPVQSGQELTIRAGEYNTYMLRLAEGAGRLIRDYWLVGTEATLSTNGLAAGLYPYAIFRNNECIQTGKVLIR